MQSGLFAICRQVSIEEGDAKAREFSVMFIETSAKAGFNIKVGRRICRQHHALSSAQASRGSIAVCVEDTCTAVRVVLLVFNMST